MRGKRLGDILVDLKLIDALQLRSALAYQRQWGHRLGRCLVELRMCTEETITRALSLQLGIPCVRLDQVEVKPQIAALVSARVAQDANAVPLALTRSRSGRTVLQIAMSDPCDLETIDGLRFATGIDIEPVLAGETDVQDALQRLYQPIYELSTYGETYELV